MSVYSSKKGQSVSEQHERDVVSSRSSVNNRPEVIDQFRLKNAVDNSPQLLQMRSLQKVTKQNSPTDYASLQTGNSPMQLATFVKTNSNADRQKLLDARKNKYPQGGTANHNFAVGKSYPITWAHSNNTGHSEARAAANTLGILWGGGHRLELLSERDPCGACRDDMNDIEDSSGDNFEVRVKWIVDHDVNASDNLRDIYEDL